VICAIVHSVKGNFELDRLGDEWLSDNFDWNERNIIYIVVLVDSSRRRKWCRGIVGDGRGDIWEAKSELFLSEE
jgi:hypothetical protein